VVYVVEVLVIIQYSILVVRSVYTGKVVVKYKGLHLQSDEDIYL